MFIDLKEKMDLIAYNSVDEILSIIDTSFYYENRNDIYDTALYLLDFQKNYTRELGRSFQNVNKDNEDNIVLAKNTRVWKRNTFNELTEFIKLSYAFDIKIRELNLNYLQDDDLGILYELANKIKNTLLRMDLKYSLFSSLQKKNDELLDVLSLKEVNKIEEYKKVSDLAMYSCQYYGCFFSPKSKVFANLYSILRKLNTSISDDGLELKKIINFDRCCAFAVLELKNSNVENIVSFSGGWDIGSVMPKYKSKLNAYFDIIIGHVLNYYKMKNTEVAKMSRNMISFNINFDNYKMTEKCYLGDVINKGTKSIGCIKKHYSCVERKIISHLIKRSRIRKITFYVTMSPCLDCNKALNDLGTGNKVVVNYEKKYKGSNRNCRSIGCLVK